MSEEANNINLKQLEKLRVKAKELGYSNLAFFIDDMDVLLRPANLLKQKDMKYFELENLITLLASKNISLGMAPRMISMVSKYSERNEELESENATLKQENISLSSKYQTAEFQVKEIQKQLQEISAGSHNEVKIREENIKLTEENKYLKMTNESLTEDLKKTKTKLDEKTDEISDLEAENNQMEMLVKDSQREIKDLKADLEEERKQEKGGDSTKKRIEDIIEELDDLYETVDDPFKKEFLAFFGVELSEIVDERTITKQKILNQIAIHAHEIEKVFEPKIVAMQKAQVSTTPIESKKTLVEEASIPEPVVRKAPKEAEIEIDEEEEIAENSGDRYVKPSEFLKKKGIHIEKGPTEKEKDDKDAEEEEEKPVSKPVSYPKKKKAPEPDDRAPSPELVKVFDIFIKYLEAINDNNSFNDLCDKIIEELYEHVGSPGMTKVYKIKSGGIKRKQMLIDLLNQWKSKLPDM
ncbi:MAG: hypothetical protein FK734_11930 [Asgard group archaeon]|nr:hypothetical protein [Asgard group archaeon]